MDSWKNPQRIPVAILGVICKRVPKEVKKILRRFSAGIFSETRGEREEFIW